MPPAHPLLDSHPGIGLKELRANRKPELTSAQWLQEDLCERLWTLLLDAGAHPTPDDLKLPGRAILAATLVDAYLEGSRVVDQRIGDNLWPVSVPHWSLEVTWRVRFEVRYGTGEQGPGLDLVLRGTAHQEDYQKLDLELLLEKVTGKALSRLPRVLADEGRLGELMFTITQNPPLAPDSWNVDGILSDSFGLLLSTATNTRHGALAIYLSSPQIAISERASLARWFAINEPDLPLRRDALAWLMQQEPAAKQDQAMSSETVELLAWLLHRATSHRIRVAAVMALADRKGPQIRRLLLVGAGDADPRVAEVALSQLRNFKAATAQELDDRGQAPALRLPSWTTTLDGRLASGESKATRRLFALAHAAGGDAARLWLNRWLQKGEVDAADSEWTLSSWKQLSNSPNPAIRKAALQRLIRERQRLGVEDLLVERAEQERDVSLLVLALSNLDDGPRELNVLLSASSGPERQVRRAAAAALGTQSASSAELRLRALVRDDPDRKVRAAARKALRKRARSKR